MLGAGITGPSAGEGLRETRAVWTTWEDWRRRHPQSKVLSIETGHARNYRSDPYGSYNPLEGYYTADAPRLFPVLHEDDRYPPKHEIFGFRDGAQAVAVEPGFLAERGVLHHRGPGGDYVIIHDPGLDTAWVFRGATAASVDTDTVSFGPQGPTFPGREALEPVHGFTAMWFAWVAFYPGTEVLDGSEPAWEAVPETRRETRDLLCAHHSGIFRRSLSSHANHHACFTIAEIGSLRHALATLQDPRTASRHPGWCVPPRPRAGRHQPLARLAVNRHSQRTRHFARDTGVRWPAAGVGLAYAQGYLFALGDLDVVGRTAWAFRTADVTPSKWIELRDAFRFEAVAIADLGHLAVLVSPLNLAVAGTLGALLALNVHGAFALRRAPAQCVRGGGGLLGAVPALLAGGACCAPSLVLLLGIPGLGAFAAFFGWLIPLSAVLLIANHRWQRRCGAPGWRSAPSGDRSRRWSGTG